MTVFHNEIAAAEQAGIFLNGLLVSNRRARIKQEEKRRRPLYFCFEGPDGVGKSLLGKNLLTTALISHVNAVLTRGSGSAVGTQETLTELTSLKPGFEQYEGFQQTIISFKEALELQTSAGDSFDDRINLQRSLFDIVNQALNSPNGGIVISDRGIASVLATGAEMLADRYLTPQVFNQTCDYLSPPIPDLIIYPKATLDVLIQRNNEKSKPTRETDLELRHAMMETIFGHIDNNFVLRLDATQSVQNLNTQIWRRVSAMNKQMGSRV